MPEGLALLVGPPKIGKSWLALNVAVAIANGAPALGHIPVDRGDVLYLALEDPPRRLQERLRNLLGSEGWPASLEFETRCAVLDNGGYEVIEDYLRKHPNARAVIVDVWARISGRTPSNSSAYALDYARASKLKELADQYRIAIVVLHHSRKGEADDWLELVSGTQGLSGCADTIMLLTRARGSADAILRVTGRDVEEAEHALSFDTTTFEWQMLGGVASDYEQSAQRRLILEAVRSESGIGPKRIAELSGVDYSVVRQLVRRMERQGMLKAGARGTYSPVHDVHDVHGRPDVGR